MKVQHPPEEIVGPRIRLCKHKVEQAAQMFSYIDQDRQRLRQFLPWVDGTLTATDTKRWIEHCERVWEGFEMYDYGIFRSSDNLYMGNFGVHAISWENERCEIGYWVLSEFEGHGYVSEAVQIIEKKLFELGFYRIEIRCSTANARSAAVPQRCQYRLEATLRGHAIEYGKRRDTLIFAKLATDGSSETKA